MTIHTRVTLDRELHALEIEMLRMGSKVDDAIRHAVKALSDHDSELAQQIIVDDAAINAQQFEIEETCIRVIATQQPAAIDLRAVVAAMSIITNLERMGDHAAGIAKTVLSLDGQLPQRPLKDISQMSRVCREMLHKVLDAYVERNTNLAYAIASQDDLIDDHYQNLFHDLVNEMLAEPNATNNGLRLLFAGHNLERIGDRATNIAEQVIFMTSGQILDLNEKQSVADFTIE